jgi:hypothetical protein
VTLTRRRNFFLVRRLHFLAFLCVCKFLYQPSAPRIHSSAELLQESRRDFRIQLRLRRGFVYLDLARARVWLSRAHCSTTASYSGARCSYSTYTYPHPGHFQFCLQIIHIQFDDRFFCELERVRSFYIHFRPQSLSRIS